MTLAASSGAAKDANHDGEGSEAFVALTDAIRRYRKQIEADARIPDDIVAMMKSAGVYRAAVPQRFGGDGASLPELLRMLERIAAADGSVGWAATFGPQMASFLGALSREGLEAFYRDGPDIISAGALFPLQKARLVDGDVEISGRWKFASGSLHADSIGVGLLLEDDERQLGKPVPRVALLDPRQVTIVPNWDVVGLVATGSHDVMVKGARVPLDRTFLRGADPAYLEPIYLFPPVTLAALTFAAVAVGIAQDALAELYSLAKGKVSLAGGSPLAERAIAQIEMARSDYRLRASERYLVTEADRAWNEVASKGALSRPANLNLRMAAIQATDDAASAVATAFRLAGTTAIFLDHPLQRHLRDVNVVAQHAFLSPDHVEQAGRMLFDRPTSPHFP
ncbi:acyl-CoA dehydrogenase family protein [Amorphus sp. 3PC139-8]|uniref:acyl-CoA dehydrogenase family protein n=1 Tax=Amorphus sp. 3PC139-8 TaxID=2735676 RepID=UPI00345C6EC2